MIPRTVFNEDHEQFRASFRKFLEQEAIPHQEQWEERGQVSREVYLRAGEQGFLCPTVPEHCGGLGLDYRYNAVIDEEISRAGLSGLAFALHSNVVAPYITEFGSAALIDKYIPKMLTGELIGAIAMTEPGTGSDLQAVKATALRDGDHYVLNGAKTFITNGQLCDLVIVVCKTDPEQGARGISLLLVEADSPGFSKGRTLKKIGMKAQDTAEMFFDNVRVPVANLIGEEGKGFGYLMTKLAQERLSLGVCAVASAEEALRETVAYVKGRKVFGKAVADYQNTQFKLAELDAEVTAARVFVDKCIELFVARRLDATTAAKLKLLASEMLCRVTDECLQLHGGYGYMWEYKIARMYADARVNKIFAGSNEIMKMLIGRELLK